MHQAFLSNPVFKRAKTFHYRVHVIVGGGFEDSDSDCTTTECDVSYLHVTYVDADTKMIMHDVGGAHSGCHICIT